MKLSAREVTDPVAAAPRREGEPAIPTWKAFNCGVAFTTLHTSHPSICLKSPRFTTAHLQATSHSKRSHLNQPITGHHRQREREREKKSEEIPYLKQICHPSSISSATPRVYTTSPPATTSSTTQISPRSASNNAPTYDDEDPLPRFPTRRSTSSLPAL